MRWAAAATGRAEAGAAADEAVGFGAVAEAEEAVGFAVAVAVVAEAGAGLGVLVYAARRADEANARDDGVCCVRGKEHRRDKPRRVRVDAMGFGVGAGPCQFSAVQCSSIQSNRGKHGWTWELQTVDCKLPP